ncbi:hypothetical protein Poli38472_006329 [Pythium oligandrum]|uniref:J domain-containing protein n=1 Tax=Pythium oligandrum TaxID=41045 RepID=A0A8K1C4E8_PYTOL|nr:hypothetical protein Poli38472_006329 [Pythium oligandrum]|eukprot:TMW56319.1 hypothetical protein Poli38472_006329 [Pythium oligandrum]
MSDEYERDHYGVLGLEAGADAEGVARAYKKKSLKHHPDRGGDVKKFLELKESRDFLLDPKKKERYDEKLYKNMMARKRQLEREKELSSKRRKMRDEFLQKEKDAELRRKEQKDGAKLQSEMKRLREKMMMQRQEMAESMARDAQRRRDAGDWKEGDVGSKSQRTVSFKWDSKQFSHSDDTISRALREYGAIDSLKVKGSSAKVLFASKSAAAQAVRVEGHKDCWRSVSLKGHIVDFEDDATGPASETKHSTNYLPDGPIDLEEHLAFERLVLQKLRDRIRSHEARESVGVS